MIISRAGHFISTWRRVGLWFGSLLLAVALFSLLFILHGSRPGYFQVEGVFWVFCITFTFAFPVWCLYLPVVIKLNDAEGRRLWAILGSGVLIGPVAFALYDFLYHLGGGEPDDPLAPSMTECVFFALIVGSLTTIFYVIALKVHKHWPLAAKYGSA